jgi:hypothetical protein
MRSALRRIRWGLLAAGALGLAGPSLAQTPPPAAGADGAGPARTAAAAAALAEQMGRLEAGYVELAWLADPLTFPYALTARPAGSTLEVRGEVPGPGVKKLALTMARAHSTLPVTDLLTINPDLESRRPGADAGRLQHEATALLTQALPEQARGISVDAQPDGRVIVAGAVATCDDRLAVSRLMRRVSGCSCVVNHLEVGRLFAAGRAEGKGATAAAVSKALTPVKASEPAGAPAPLVQAVAREAAPLPPELLPQRQGAGHAGGEAALLVVTPPAQRSQAGQTVAALTPPATPPGRAQEKAAPAAGGYVTAGVMIRQVENPSATAKPGETAHPAKPPAPAGGYVTAGVMIRSGESAAPAPGSARTPKPVQPAGEAGAPYPAAVLRGSPALDVPKLKRRIELVCGRTARDVEIVPHPDNGVEIRFRVASVEDGERVSAKMMALPELAPYQVSFTMKLDR